MQQPYNTQNSSGQDFQQQKINIAIYDSDTPVTLKQGHCHQSCMIW